MITMKQGMRTSLGMKRRNSAMMAFEQVSTTITAALMATALFKPVVTASVGQRPTARTKTAFRSNSPFENSSLSVLSAISRKVRGCLPEIG